MEFETDFSWLLYSSRCVNFVSLSKIPMGRDFSWFWYSSSLVSCVSLSKTPLGMDWSLLLSRCSSVSSVSLLNTPSGRDFSLCSVLFSFLGNNFKIKMGIQILLLIVKMLVLSGSVHNPMLFWYYRPELIQSTFFGLINTRQQGYSF